MKPGILNNPAGHSTAERWLANNATVYDLYDFISRFIIEMFGVNSKWKWEWVGGKIPISRICDPYLLTICARMLLALHRGF
jgi:hypothetical protein